MNIAPGMYIPTFENVLCDRSVTPCITVNCNGAVIRAKRFNLSCCVVGAFFEQAGRAHGTAALARRGAVTLRGSHSGRTPVKVMSTLSV